MTIFDETENGTSYILADGPPTVHPAPQVKITARGDSTLHLGGARLGYTLVVGAEQDAGGRCECGLEASGRENAVFNVISAHARTGRSIF